MGFWKEHRRIVIAGTIAAMTLSGIVACGDSSKDKKPSTDAAQTAQTAAVDTPTDPTSPNDFLLPFRIAFKADGSPVLLDEKGNIEEWERAKLPLETKRLYALKTISVAVVQGSCTVLISNPDGSLSERKYPSKLCKYWGIPEN